MKQLDRAVEAIAEELLAGPVKPGMSVAVLPFRNSEGEVSQLGRMVADGLTQRLVRSGRCTALDRNYITAMLDEIKLGMAGLVDQKTALQVGKFSGAKYLVVGTLEPYGKKKLVVQARLLETETAGLVGASKASLDMDAGFQEMYRRAAGLDEAGRTWFEDEKVSDDAVVLNQAGTAGCRWVEARAESPIRAGPGPARASAITLARQKAVRRVLGFTQPAQADFEEGAFEGRIESALRAMRSERVLDEKIVEEKVVGENYRVVLQACVKPAPAGAGDFRVDLVLNQNRFVQGQEARAIIVPSQDAYVLLYSVDFDQNAQLVYPLPGMAAGPVEAGRHFVFPDEEHRQAGVRLTAELPPGADRSIETLRALAVKRDVSSKLAGAATYPEIARRLDAAGVEWAEDVRLFTIYKR